MVRNFKDYKYMQNKSNEKDFSGQNIYVGLDTHLKSWKVTIRVEDDYSNFRLITIQLVLNGVCKQSAIVKTFGVSPKIVKR